MSPSGWVVLLVFLGAGVIEEGVANEWELIKAEARRGVMRITKRSSGGRGEYEVSENHGSLTPRDILNRCIILEVGDLRIPTGVALLNRNGKRRLRLDASSGAEIHLHRQLAAVLLMPYPARGETAWGESEVVMESDRYGIDNIDLSEVALEGSGSVQVVPDRLEIANRSHQGHINCAERLGQVRTLWTRRDELPQAIAGLLTQHEQLVRTGNPLGPAVEDLIADLQRGAVAHWRQLGIAGDESRDVIPLLIALLPKPTDLEALTPSGQGEPDPQNHDDGTGPSPEDIEAPLVPTVPLEPVETVPPAELSGRKEISSRPVPRPRRYQPQQRGALAPKRHQPATAEEGSSAERSCLIEVRVRMRVGGTFAVSLLPRRREGMPEDVDVAGAGEEMLTLSAFHESWYQDVFPRNLGAILQEGVAWYADRADGRLQWGLSGRCLYVLGPRDELSGFVSLPRLILGDQHVVLCTEELRQQAEELLHGCCGQVPPSLNSADGLPEGWCGFRAVVPKLSLPAGPTPNILDALRPDRDVQILLRGGIHLHRSEWLLGYPPSIRLAGAADEPPQLYIDNTEAVCASGSYTAPGWDALGNHVVSCESVTRTYGLANPPDRWDAWPAHPATVEAIAVCGALAGECASEVGRPLTLVPEDTSLLIGPRPGDLHRCAVRGDVRTGVCVAAPSFTPVWALPPAPLHADKTTARIRCAGSLLPPQPEPSSGVSSATVRLWCTAILDCARKGLALAEPSPDAVALWREYRSLARAIWRWRR